MISWLMHYAVFRSDYLFPVLSNAGFYVCGYFIVARPWFFG